MKDLENCKAEATAMDEILFIVFIATKSKRHICKTLSFSVSFDMSKVIQSASDKRIQTAFMGDNTCQRVYAVD